MFSIRLRSVQMAGSELPGPRFWYKNFAITHINSPFPNTIRLSSPDVFVIWPRGIPLAISPTQRLLPHDVFPQLKQRRGHEPPVSTAVAPRYPIESLVCEQQRGVPLISIQLPMILISGGYFPTSGDNNISIKTGSSSGLVAVNAIFHSSASGASNTCSCAGRDSRISHGAILGDS